MEPLLDADLLETYGMTSLLFEIPTGFAVFNFYAISLYVPNVIESIWVNFAEHFLAEETVWLNEFQTFDDKSSAINVDTGVDEKLTKMIMNCHCPKKKLLVGKPEYKSIIEKILIVATARVLFKCDDVEKEEYRNLCLIRHYLKKVSGIDYESWDALKLATAFKIISRREVGDSEKMFPEDVISKLLSDADKYATCSLV